MLLSNLLTIHSHFVHSMTEVKKSHFPWEDFMKFKKGLAIYLVIAMVLQLFIPLTTVQAIASTEETIVLVGSLQNELGAASDWAPSDMTTRLKAIDGTNYYFYVGKLPAGQYEYKVAMNGSWDLSYGQFNYGSATYANGNNFSIDNPTEQDVLFLFNTDTKKLSAIYDNASSNDYNIHLAGDMNSWNKDDATSKMLSLSNGYYTKEYTLSAGTYEYKYIFDQNWDKALGTPSGGNKQLVLATDSTVLFVFDAVSMTETVLFKTTTDRPATLVGTIQPALGGAATWTPTSVESDMNYYGQGIYYREALIPSATAPHEYKVAMNHDWAESYTQVENNNTPLTLTADQTIAFLFNDTTKRLFDSTGCSLNVTGNLQTEFGASADWAPADSITTMSSQGGLMTFVGDIPASNYEMKFTLDGSWYKSYGINGVDSGANIPVVATNRREFVIAREDLFNHHSTPLDYLWISDDGSSDNEPTLKSPVKNNDGTITFNVSKTDPSYDASKGTLYIIGSFNGWNESTQVALVDSGSDYLTTTIDFESTYGITNTMIQYKFKYVSWGGDFADSLNPEVSGSNSLVEVGIAPENLSYHVTGSFQGWSGGDDNYKMTDSDGDGIYELTIPLASARHEYKVTQKYKGAITWIPDGTNNNHVADVKTAGNVTFYFNSNLYNDGTNMNPVASSLDMMLMDFYVKDITSGTTYGPMSDTDFNGTYTYDFPDLAAGNYSFAIEDEEGNPYALNSTPYEVSLNETFNLQLAYNSGQDYILDNYAPFIDGLIDSTMLLHDSWDSTFRSKFGAIPKNTVVDLSIQTKKGDASKVLIVINGKPYKLNLISSNSVDLYGDSFLFENIGTYDYYFIVQDGENALYYSGTTGKGAASAVLQSPYTITVFQENYATPDWMKLSVTYQIFGDRFNNGDATNDHAKLYNYGDTPLQFPTWDDYRSFEDTRYSEISPDNYTALSAAEGWDNNWHNEVYGGDLAGVTQKLDYLQSLGVKTIYFNPIFESISAHKYDSADYSQLDPRFGTNTDFIVLAQEAKTRGMNIILDGVFNHVGSDSLYFNKYGKNYEDDVLGTYEAWILKGHKDGNADATLLYETLLQGNSGDNFRTDAFYAPYLDGTKVIESPYASWFKIQANGEYEGWWGYDSLPVIQSLNGSELNVESFVDYIIENDDSIARQWIENGSSGWRLDVSPEVSMDFWLQLRSYIKGADKGDILWSNGEPIILAENWGDATSDFLSGAFDSTMNYRFREAAIEFVVDEVTYSKYNSTGLVPEETWTPSDAATVNKELMTYLEKYPKESSYVLMNLLGSHDVPRILGVLGYLEVDRPLYPATINSIATDLGITLNSENIIYLEDFVTYNLIDQTTLTNYINTRNESARKRYMLATVLQMTYPGSPTIYYGDEVGMSGYHDPDNRRQFNWSLATPQNNVLDFISDLAKVRNENLTLQTGEFVPILAEENSDVYVFGRYINGATDAVGNTSYITNYATNRTIEVAKNQGRALVIMNKNATSSKTLMVPVAKVGAVDGDKFRDAMSNTKFVVKNGTIEVTVAALSGMVLINDKKASETNGNGNSNGNNTSKEVTLEDDTTPEALFPFLDIMNIDWAKNAISKLFKQGILRGTSSTTYEPNRYVLRSEFAAMVSRFISSSKKTIDNSLNPATPSATMFSDVQSTQWYYADLLTVSGRGYMNGNGLGLFLPNARITRQEAAVVIANILNDNDFERTIPTTLLPFSDISKISPWALDSMALCYEVGILVGDKNKLNPTKPLTRAEAAVIIDRLITLLDK